MNAESACPKCGSSFRGYIRGPCTVNGWGNWHSWHDRKKEEMATTKNEIIVEALAVCMRPFADGWDGSVDRSLEIARELQRNLVDRGIVLELID